jgi:hypothetical protein
MDDGEELTVKVKVVVQPEVAVAVKVTTPGLMAVTSPVVNPIVAIPVALDVHVTPGVGV